MSKVLFFEIGVMFALNGESKSSSSLSDWSKAPPNLLLLIYSAAYVNFPIDYRFFLFIFDFDNSCVYSYSLVIILNDDFLNSVGSDDLTDYEDSELTDIVSSFTSNSLIDSWV